MRSLLAIVLLLSGCAASSERPRILVEGHPPRIYQRVENGRQVSEIRSWYDAEELDEVVREYVRRNRVDFDFRGTHAQFWVHRDRDHLARADYSSGLGRPVLSAKIGWDGRVTEHYIAIAVCGVGLADDAVPVPDDAQRGGE